MFPKNKKGMTLMEMMVVVIIIVGLVLAAYPTYLSSLEKARAQEAVQLISHLAAAQDKFKAECYNMNSSTGECYYSSDFRRLPVDIAGPNKNDGNVSVEKEKITTPGYIYAIEKDYSVVAMPNHRTSYKYTIVANVTGSEILCKTGGEKSGIKICGAIGKKITGSTDYKID